MNVTLRFITNSREVIATNLDFNFCNYYFRWFLLHDYYLGLLKIEPVLMNLTEFKLKSMDIGFTENPPRDE